MNISENKTTWVNVSLTGLYSALASILIFLIIFSASANIAQDWILAYVNIAQDNNWFSYAIVLGGFILMGIIQIISTILNIDDKKDFNSPLIAVGIAFIVNVILWMVIAQTVIKFTYAEVVEGLTFLEKLVLSPRILVIFSVVSLGHPFVFWGASLITQTILYVIFTKIIADNEQSLKKTSYNYKAIY